MKARLSPAELRQFGLTLAAALAGVFGLVLPWLFEFAYPLWPWVAGAAIFLPALVYPRALTPLYALWRPVALAIGYINTRLILGLVFFLVILPFGVLARLIGKLQYEPRIDRAAGTYRVRIDADRHRQDYERPF